MYYSQICSLAALMLLIEIALAVPKKKKKLWGL